MKSRTREILDRRARHLPRNLSILYPQDPIHVVRAQGQFLYDDAGIEYLDCMNNVPQVGHSHPRLAEVASRQLRAVNTNTRFLYEPLVDFADRLSELTPESLDVCYFVNSGSEANELALRLAHSYTHRRGVVALSGAYHGTTTSLTDISAYKFDGPGGNGRPPHVQIAPAPDPYRGPYRGLSSFAEYAREVNAAMVRGVDAGHPAAVLMAEPMLGTGGQIIPPPGYLPAAYQAARDHGALVVADEIQVGLGRVGTDFWACRALGATPDILTVGKPIGNGYPLGAVVTTREIAAAFDNGMEYFNTFGGSPLSCSIGLEVLDILVDEELPSRAASVGQYFLSGLTSLMDEHPVIGDVRGSGLFIGVEFVTDPISKEPATALARSLVTQLRNRHILMSTDGVDDNVLKIKPPLVFSRDDVDRVLEAVDAVLRTMPVEPTVCARG